MHRTLWAALGAVLLGTFLILGFFGREIYRQAPPIPAQVVTEDGRELATATSILDGQQAWQSLGGQQVGSIWGHGAYQAPDWSADWLHREALALLERWSQRDHGQAYDDLPPEVQAGLRERLRREMRTNRYDPATGRLVVSADRGAAIEATAAHYVALFGGDPALAGLREDYAMRARTSPSSTRSAVEPRAPPSGPWRPTSGVLAQPIVRRPSSTPSCEASPQRRGCATPWPSQSSTSGRTRRRASAARSGGSSRSAKLPGT